MKLNIYVSPNDLKELEEFKKIGSYATKAQSRGKVISFFISLYTQLYAEIRRNLRVFVQNIFSPIFSTFIYFLIFGSIMGQRIGDVGGVPYILFLVPGFMMMPVISNSFSNGSFTTFFRRHNKQIEDTVRAPISIHNFILGTALGGTLRGIFVAIAIYITSIGFTGSAYIAHPFLFFFLIIIVSLSMAIIGIISGALATSFDTSNNIEIFFIVPLSYLSGTFYDVNQLPAVFKWLSYINPLTYIVSLLREFYLGIGDSNVYFGLTFLCLVLLSCYYLGVKIISKRLNIL